MSNSYLTLESQMPDISLMWCHQKMTKKKKRFFNYHYASGAHTYATFRSEERVIDWIGLPYY